MAKHVSFNGKLIFIFLAINCYFSSAQTLIKESITSFFATESVSTSVHFHVTTKERSLISCVFRCQIQDFPTFYYLEKNETCFCSSSDDSNTGEHEISGTGIIHGMRTQKVSTSYIQGEGKKIKRIHKEPEPIDCLALNDQGFHENGVYVINPTGSSSTDVWCDMSNGGWTVIQRRQDGSQDFYKTWDEYKNGFGNKFGEYWLGLENIHYLTIPSSSLYIYMETFMDDNEDPLSAFAEYSTFRINNESDKYRLAVGGYNGSCGDSMSNHNDRQFTTKDSDNDIYNTNCAVLYGGAWWYASCHLANLNGLYLAGANTDFGRGINWQRCWGHYYSLKTTVMKIKRNK